VVAVVAVQIKAQQSPTHLPASMAEVHPVQLSQEPWEVVQVEAVATAVEALLQHVQIEMAPQVHQDSCSSLQKLCFRSAPTVQSNQHMLEPLQQFQLSRLLEQLEA
jgi:hypothetical protein